MAARLVRLRRPPTLSSVPGPHVPAGADLDEVERRWQALRRRNPAYFDGRVCHVTGVHRNGCGGAVLHVVDCAYRFYAVQTADYDLGVRPLGVKGITMRAGRVLAGRRSRSVAGHPGCWELAPGGAVEPGRRPVDVVRAELREETSLSARSEPIAVAVLFDPGVRTWEVVFRIDPDAGDPVAARAEYDELRWCDPAALPAPLSPIARRLAALLEKGTRYFS